MALFNRGNNTGRIPEGAVLIQGDKTELATYRDEIGDFAPEAALHIVAYESDDANQFVTAMKGICNNLTVVSSGDVYLAFGRLHQTEPGPIELCPLIENSLLRRKLSIHGEKNEKQYVERIVLESGIPSTVLRLPAVYGPGDLLGRWYPFLKRMKDGRPRIILGEKQAQWRFGNGYVENVAHAICLAVTKRSFENRVFNVSEKKTPTLKELVEGLACFTEWEGSVLVVPDQDLPEHLKSPGDCRQSLYLDSSRIRKELGFTEIVDEETAARRSIEWYLENAPKTMNYGRLLYEKEDEVIEKCDGKEGKQRMNEGPSYAKAMEDVQRIERDVDAGRR